MSARPGREDPTAPGGPSPPATIAARSPGQAVWLPAAARPHRDGQRRVLAACCCRAGRAADRAAVRRRPAGAVPAGAGPVRHADGRRWRDLAEHWFGLEPGLGRDIFIRMVYGMRTSLLIAFAAATMTTAIGVAGGRHSRAISAAGWTR